MGRTGEFAVPELGGIAFGEELGGEFADVGSGVELHVEAFGPVHDGLIDPSVGAIPERGARRAMHALLNIQRELKHFVRYALAALDECLVDAVVNNLEKAELLAGGRDRGHQRRAGAHIARPERSQVHDGDSVMVKIAVPIAGAGVVDIVNIPKCRPVILLLVYEHGRQRRRVVQHGREQARVPERGIGVREYRGQIRYIVLGCYRWVRPHSFPQISNLSQNSAHKITVTILPLELSP